MNIQEKQATWNKERPLFEADFIHSHLLPFFNFNENTGDYEIKSEFAEDEDHNVAFETLNTGWVMWLRAKRGAKAEINELKAKLEKLEKSKSGVVLTCSQLLEAFQFGAPDGESDADQMATEMVIRWFEDGHSGAGYYCYYSDYPEDGAIFLGEEAAQGEGHE